MYTTGECITGTSKVSISTAPIAESVHHAISFRQILEELEQESPELDEKLHWHSTHSKNFQFIWTF